MKQEKEKQESSTRGRRRIFNGIVISDAMDKTLVVRVDRIVSHPVYKKRYVRSKKYKVHDEQNFYHVGNKVEFREDRPISRQKRWRVIYKDT